MTVEIADGEVRVSGNKCKKGEAYGKSEAVEPMRILTSTVRTKGLAVQMVPVRTDKPVPRSRLTEAMKIIRSIRIEKPVKAGEIILERFLGLEVNLVATRSISS